MVDSAELKGIDELLAKLKEVGDDVQHRGGRFALRKAANLVAGEAKSGWDQVDRYDTPNNIGANIAVRWDRRRFRSTGDLKFSVGVLGGARSQSRDALRAARYRRRKGIASLAEMGEIEGSGSRNPGGDTWYWRLLEFGTSRIAAKGVMRNSLESNIGRATNEFVEQYKKALDRAIKRAGK